MVVSSRARAAPEAVVGVVAESDGGWTEPACLEVVGPGVDGGVVVGGGCTHQNPVAAPEFDVIEGVICGGGTGDCLHG